MEELRREAAILSLRSLAAEIAKKAERPITISEVRRRWKGDATLCTEEVAFSGGDGSLGRWRETQFVNAKGEHLFLLEKPQRPMTLLSPDSDEYKAEIEKRRARGETVNPG